MASAGVASSPTLPSPQKTRPSTTTPIDRVVESVAAAEASSKSVITDDCGANMRGVDNVNWNQNVLLGCLAAVALAALLAAGVVVVALNRDRNVVHYPNAVPLASHSNYSGLPFQFRWDNSYLTTDNFTDVYNWYSTTFDLGAESRAIERCILLEGPADSLLIERYYSILLCNTPQGQHVYVTRSTRLKLD